MDGEVAGQLGGGATSSSSPRAKAHLSTSSDDEDCDDLYGDVGFLPLLPLSPSPTPSSPPKTPSLGRTPSPSSPPHRTPAPESRPVHKPEPQPKPSATPYQTPRPPPPSAPRHQIPQPQRSRGDSSSSLPGTALYISELPWWATDAEVEAALAPHAAPALRGLFFYSDKFTGMSRGICRAEFLSPAAATAAAVALHGRAFHGRNCVASLSRPPALNRLGDDSDAEPVQAAPNPYRGRGSLGSGRGASNATPVRGNVGPIWGDRLAPAPLPQLRMAPRPHRLPFGGTIGGGGGYCGFQPLGQFNAGMGTGMMPPAVAPHVNSAFLAAGGMAMCGPGMWPDQAMDGGFWGAQPPWNFRGCQLPWQQPAPIMQVQQQQHADVDFGKWRGMRRGRPGRNDERGIDNVRSFPEKRQSDHDGGELYKECDHEERRRRQESSPEKEREPERHWDEGDRRGGNKRRCQEYAEDDDDDRKARAKARSQPRNDGYDDHPRRRR